MQEAVAQVVDRGHAVSEVADRLGISTKSLYAWKALFSKPVAVCNSEAALAAELRRVKKERVRVTEERDILEKGRHVLRARVSVENGFIKDHQAVFSIRTTRRMLMVHVSGFFAWLKEPSGLRAREDLRQTDLIRQAWTDCSKVYGYRKLHDDLRDKGETCSENRVARLA